MITPDQKTFVRLAASYDVVPVSIEAAADELTPMALLHARYASSPSCFLLESVEGGEHLGRYSMAAFAPEAVVRSPEADPIAALRERLKLRAADVDGMPRFWGGAVGFLSYDVVRRFEKLPSRLPDRLGTPESVFFFTRDLFVFDHVRRSLKIVRAVRTDGKRPAASLYRETVSSLKRELSNVRPASAPPRPFAPVRPALPDASPAEKRRYEAAVRRAKEYIAAGDLIQVVLSRRVERACRAHPLEVYRALRRVNPSPYMYFVRDRDLHVIGSSPEMLVRLEDGRAETRPIAGTRPRGATPELDARLAGDLSSDPKERAEHVMLVDLGRNDLGRVCRPGTVRVPQFMEVERYSHVMHLVSSVVGELSKDKDALDLLRAVFPAGTVSGAPKIRAMEIIEELEDSRRGPYAGAVGAISYTGNMDLAITIRTILLNKGKAYVQTGAGIVADSDPASEFRETQNKAAAMMAALRLAEEPGRSAR